MITTGRVYTTTADVVSRENRNAIPAPLVQYPPRERDRETQYSAVLLSSAHPVSRIHMHIYSIGTLKKDRFVRSLARSGSGGGAAARGFSGEFRSARGYPVRRSARAREAVRILALAGPFLPDALQALQREHLQRSAPAVCSEIFARPAVMHLHRISERELLGGGVVTMPERVAVFRDEDFF